MQFCKTAIKKVSKIVTRNQNKVNDAAWNLSTSVRESNQAIVDSVVSAQERNMKFAQNIFENEVELLKSHAEHTRSVMEEVVGEPEKSQAFFPDHGKQRCCCSGKECKVCSEPSPEWNRITQESWREHSHSHADAS